MNGYEPLLYYAGARHYSVIKVGYNSAIKLKISLYLFKLITNPACKVSITKLGN